MQLSDAEIVESIIADRFRLLHSEARPSLVRITRWPKALPHYTREHAEILNGIDLPKGIFLTGNYLGHIGLSNILEYNKQLAEKICG
jgi:protoporphyrinogen oxidase